MPLKLLVCLLAASLAGCATQQRMWYLNGKSQQQLDGAYAFCEKSSQSVVDAYEAEDAGYNMGSGMGSRSGGLASLGLLQLALLQSRIDSAFVACMEQNGFKEAKKK